MSVGAAVPHNHHREAVGEGGLVGRGGRDGAAPRVRQVARRAGGIDHRRASAEIGAGERALGSGMGGAPERGERMSQSAVFKTARPSAGFAR